LVPRPRSRTRRTGGCTVAGLRLADHGVYGNGHMMTLEENDADVLDVVLDWVEDTLEP
jgi:hypothetical protein